MADSERLAILDKALQDGNGILRCEPAWVARNFLPPGRRLGLEEAEYEMGERGFICERWLCSVTHADNAIGPEDEGQSYLDLESGERMTLKEALEIGGGKILETRALCLLLHCSSRGKYSIT